jgi:hypothetical protein
MFPRKTMHMKIENMKIMGFLYPHNKFINVCIIDELQKNNNKENGFDESF